MFTHIHTASWRIIPYSEPREWGGAWVETSWNQKIDAYIATIELAKLPDREARLWAIKVKIDTVSDAKNTTWDEKSRWILMNRLVQLYQTESSRSDTGIGSVLSNFIRRSLGSERTLEKEESAVQRAKEQTKKTNIIHFSYFDTKTDQFEVISIRAFVNLINNAKITEINRWLFQSLIRLPNAQEYLQKEFGPDGINVIWAYVYSKPDTRLFDESDSRMKAFFLLSYKKFEKEQEKMLREKGISEMSGNFDVLFPSLKGIQFLEPEKALLRSGKLSEFYNNIVPRMSVGNMRKIMTWIQVDSKKYVDTKQIEIIWESKDFKSTLVWLHNNLFDITDPKDKEKFEKLKNKHLSHWELTPEDAKVLLLLMTKDWLTSQVGTYLMKISHHTISSTNLWWSTALSSLDKQKKLTPWKPLDAEKSSIVDNSGRFESARQSSLLTLWLAKQNSDIPDIASYDTIDKQMGEYARLQKLTQRNPMEEKKMGILKNLIDLEGKKAIAITNIVRSSNSSNIETLWLVRYLTGKKWSDTELKTWIDSQRFISTYVVEKNFVDTVELAAARINHNESTSIWALYGKYTTSDLWVSSMMSNQQNFLASLNGISATEQLMRCTVEIPQNWKNLTRTIKDPDNRVIIENVPLENISTTIMQIGRFYALWLGALVTHMREINTIISTSTGKSIWWTDGTYDLIEDKRFLRIMGTLLYGKSALPKEDNIPNLIRVFQSSDPTKNPLLKLKDLEIIDASSQVNVNTLKTKLTKASKEIGQ